MVGVIERDCNLISRKEATETDKKNMADIK